MLEERYASGERIVCVQARGLRKHNCFEELGAFINDGR